MSKSRTLAFFLTVAVCGAALDIASKVAVFHWRGASVSPEGELVSAQPGVPWQDYVLIADFFHIHPSVNPGAAFSIFIGWTGFLTVFSVVAVAVLLWIALTRPDLPRPMLLAFSLIAAGALGNLWDRLWFGAVRDFLDVFIGSSHWPTFNLADSFISCSVTALVVGELLFGRKNAERASGESASKPLQHGG